ncbi:GroES-like protein [Panus rudis PR-1116 ss-1]|nr:GroES-like protein [Panus rudis PR-1116 ss-1]
MKALIAQADKTAKVEERPIPQIAEDEILVKNVAVALNPTDWKRIEMAVTPGSISGVDFAGIVVKIGEKVTNVAIGDKVAGFVHGGAVPDEGSFAEYLKASADLVWKIPEDTLSFEEAATMGCGLLTAVQALFNPTRLGLVEPPEKVNRDEWVFVYGGSSSVGLFAVQLVHLAGYKVVSVSSPQNFELVKSLGADAVFDYRDPDVVSKIKSLTGDSIHKALDTISTESSQVLSVKTFAPGPGKLLTILAPSSSAQKVNPEVELQFTLLTTVLGRAFDFIGKHFPASPEDKAHMVQFLKKLPGFVKEGKIKPNPVKLWPVNGLDAIPEGLQYLREGKNSGEKVVHRIRE